MQNAHGLDRNIDIPTKRQVRQRCGFGCVICGLWIYEYHHFDPPFSEAKVHNPEGICLLCPTHHSRATKKLLTESDIKQANINPRALSQGFAHDKEFSLLKRPVDFFLGAIHFINPREILVLGTESLLSLADNNDGSISFNGKFYDEKGNLILEIVENEWRALSSNWDVEQVGNRIIIRNRLKRINLQIRAESGHKLVVEYLSMFYGDNFIESAENTINITTKSGAKMENLRIIQTSSAIQINTEGGIVIQGGSMIA